MKTLILLLLISFSQAFAEKVREENDFTIKVFAEHRDKAVLFTIDLPTFPQWISYGPNFHFENLRDIIVVGTDFNMPLNHEHKGLLGEKITFTLPKSTLKGLSLRLTFVDEGHSHAASVAALGNTRSTSYVMRPVHVRTFDLNNPGKDGANEEMRPETDTLQPATPSENTAPVKGQPLTQESTDAPR